MTKTTYDFVLWGVPRFQRTGQAAGLHTAQNANWPAEPLAQIAPPAKDASPKLQEMTELPLLTCH